MLRVSRTSRIRLRCSLYLKGDDRETATRLIERTVGARTLVGVNGCDAP
jgi:hypothetical protein